MRDKRRISRRLRLKRRLLANTQVMGDSKCYVTGRGSLLVVITVAYIILALFDALQSKETLDLYNAALDTRCKEAEDQDKCEQLFKGTGSVYKLAKDVAMLRFSVLAINGIVLFTTWLNQVMLGFTYVSLPWSQLAFAFIIAAVWYEYWLVYPAFELAIHQELYDSIKAAGAIAIMQFIVALTASVINELLLRKQIAGEPV